MEIKRYESDLLSSNMYLITEGINAIVIDPCRNTDMAEGLKIDLIILTHEHYDHISGVNDWKRITGAPVLCSSICAEHIKDPKQNMARHFDVFCELQTWISLTEIPESDENYSCFADEVFEDIYSFEWRGHRFDLFEIPGHSLGSIGIMLDDKFFFSGDSLIKDNKVELRLPGGSRKKWEVIGRPRIESLKDSIIIYPGHFKEFLYQKKGG